jgi:hypothetical protein
VVIRDAEAAELPVDDAEVTPGLRAIRQREAEIGLDRWPRVCMRRDIAG